MAEKVRGLRESGEIFS